MTESLRQSTRGVFDYPLSLARCHGPRGYADYASYKPWLRDEFRREFLQLLDLLNSVNDPRAVGALRSLLGFPQDLPDLANLRPPGGNNRPEGIWESAFAKRDRGELAQTY